ncbi:MAG: hypothetical protein ACK55Z_12580, partial [bacterium]
SCCAVFWDPCGHRCPENLYEAHQFLIGFRVADLQTRVQYDGFQCGVGVCWAVETFTSLALDEKEWNRGAIL